MVHKSVEIDKFSLYWNSASTPPKPKVSGFKKWFQNEDHDLTYILNPIDASAKLTINRSSASEGAAAQYALAVNVEKLDFNLGSSQLHEVFLLLESFKLSQLRERYGRFRPNVEVSKSAKWQHEWWQYAIQAVSSDVKKRLRRTSWKYLGWRLESRRRYVSLYKAKLESLQQGDPPDDGVAAELEDLEKELDMDMIILFRSLAKEKCQMGTYVLNGDDGPEFYKRSGEEQTNVRPRGWLSLFSFGMLGGSGTMDAAAEATEPFSDEIMKDLYKATNFHPKNTLPTNGDSLMTVSFQLREATARMENSNTKLGLLEINLEGLYAGIRKLQNSTSAAAVIKTFTITDLCTKDSAFRQIVLRKGVSDRYNASRLKSYAQAVYGVGISQRDLNEAAFTLDFETSDDSCLKVSAVVKPLEIIYSPLVILGLMDFFKLPPLRELDEEPEANTKAKTKLMLTIDMKNPVILIPERNCDETCSILIMALERLTIMEVHGLKELSKASSLLAGLPSNITAMKHFDVKLTGIQIGIGRGFAHSNMSLANIADCFDVQAEFLQYTDVFGTHWKLGGDSGTLSLALCAEKCRTVQAILFTAFNSFQVPGENRSSLTSCQTSGHFTVRSVNLEISMDPSAATKMILGHLEQLELKFFSGEKREVNLSAMCFTLENMDHPKSSSLRRLVRTDAAVNFTYTMLWDNGISSSQMLLQIRNAQCEIYPKIVGALSGFVASASGNRSSPGESAKTSFGLTLQLEDVTLAFHASFGTIATMKLPRSTFSLSSSDALLQEWELDGSADRLQLIGPDFTTQGLEGIPFCSVDQGSSCLRLHIAQHAAALEILVRLEQAKCILHGDYLAVIIGFITSSDWQASPTPQVEDERASSVVQYAVEVRNSLLLLPTGRGSFTEIVIPEFDFVFFPPEFDVCEVDGWSRTREETSKLFCIRGKQLSLSTYDKQCLPFINRLDGKITIEVPVDGSEIVICLSFPLIELFLAGKAFLEQISWIEVLSTDLALVGKKSSFPDSIWESLKTGNRFVLEISNGEQGKSGLTVECCIDQLRSSVFVSRKDNVWETILTGEAGGISSHCCVRGDVVESLMMKVARLTFFDGGGSAGEVFVSPGLEGTRKRLLSISVPSEIGASELKIGMTFPRVEVLLHLSSWSKVLSWIFLCFPMVPTSPELNEPLELETSDIIDSTQPLSTRNVQLRFDVPELVIQLPEFVPEGGVDEQKMISVTSVLRVENIEFGSKCQFSAQLFDIRADATEGDSSCYPWLSGNSIQIKGVLEVDLHVGLALEFNVDSIDCWCSHPVLRFFNTFRTEPAQENEDSLDLDIEVKVHGDISSVSLLLTDGRWNYDCPLLELILSRSTFEFAWSVEMLRCMVTSLLEISYHNIQKAVWEPFLEPWLFTVCVNSNCSTKSLDVSSSTSLNLNMTEGLSQVVRRTAETILWSKEQQLEGITRNRFSHYAPYWFQNDTGTVVFYTLIWPSWNEESSDHLAGDSSNWCTLLPGCSVPLFVDENEGRLQQRKPRWSTLSGASERKKFGLMSHRRMRVQLEGTAAASVPMSIDLVGSRPFEVVFSKGEGLEHEQAQTNVFVTKVLFEVSLQHHSKLIRLRSIVALANMTSLALEARLEIPFGIAPKIMEPILPKEVVPLPVHLAETGRIRLRPYGKDFLWSEAHSLSQLISSEFKPSQRPVLCYPARPSDGPFRCCINVQEQLLSATRSSELSAESRTWNLVLQAPLVIRNGLPCTLDVVIESGAGVNVHTSILKGDFVAVYEVDVVNDLNLTFTISKYRPSSLKFGGSNNRERTETGDLVAFLPEDSSGRHLYARAQKTTDYACGRREISICVQYWIYNFTGLDLACTDGDLDLRIGKQLVLSYGDTKDDSSVTAGTSSAQQGLQALLTAQDSCSACLFGLKQPGKIGSHLPSCRVVKRAEGTKLRREIYTEQVDGVRDPYLFSSAEGVEVDEHKMRLRMLQPLESPWTQPFLLDPPGGTSPIIIPQFNTKGAYLLCISSMPAAGACSGKTKIITFRPRFVLANASRQDICFKQQGTDIVHHLPVGQNIHVHWTDTARTLLLSVRYDEQGWDWSGGFALDRLGDTQVKAQNHLNGKTEILRVETIYPDAEAGSISGNERLGTFYIIVTNDETGFMPYRIDNFSAEILRFYQRRCENRENILQPYSSCDFAWDEPCLPAQLVIEVPGEGSLGAYELESVKTYPPVHLHSSGQKADRRFVVSVHAEGAKRVLSVTDIALHMEKAPKTLTPRRGEKLALSAVEKITLKLACVGVSLVDSTPQELVFASARGLSFQLSQNDCEQDLKLEVTGLQIDNQLRHAAFPVMLSTDAFTRHRSVISSEKSHSDTERATVSLTVSKWRHPMGSVDCFQCIYLSIAPLRIELEERSLTRLVVLLKSFIGGGSNMGAEKDLSFKFQSVNGSSDSLANSRFIEVGEAGPETAAEPKFPTLVSAKKKRKAYIEDFCIDPLELTISFSSIPWLPKEQRGLPAHSILSSTGSLLQRRLIALADVEGAPIRLRQLVLAHPMANWNAIIGIMQRHYTRQLLHEVYKVLGSADVLGNPMSFMRSLGSGVWDFVSAPASSMRQNPVHIVQGVRLGTQSLFRNTVFAFSNAATQMSKAARKGVLALDHEYLEHEVHEDGRDRSIVNEFLEGLTGLLQSSVVGAERHGIPGVFSGMAVGVLRAIARPAASMLEVAGKTARSIRNSSRPVQPRISRVRFPRYLEQGSALLPYSWNEALGMTVLLEAENGRLKDEVYVTCQPLVEAGVLVLLTGNYLVQVKGTGEEETETERWSIVLKSSIEDILYVDGEGNKLDVLYTNVSGSSGRGVSPFKNLSLQFRCSEAADDVHAKLLELLNRKRNVKCKIF